MVLKEVIQSTENFLFKKSMESTPLEDRIESSLYVPDSEQFEVLNCISGLRHGFFLRVPGVDVNLDREGAIARLGKSHRAAISALGYTVQDVASAEQVQSIYSIL